MLAAIFAAGMYQLTGLRNYAALAAHGVSSKGVIVGTRASHNSYRYTFQAQGHWFNHWFTASAADGASKACPELNPAMRSR